MAAFGARSKAALRGVHPTLVRILTEVTQYFDCTVLDGQRTIQQQQLNVASGLSKTLDSKHLTQDDGFAHAVDVAPTPQQWDSSPPSGLTKYEVECLAFLFYTKGYAQAQGVELRIGADWNGNNIWNGAEDGKPFNDLDHIELKEPT